MSISKASNAAQALGRLLLASLLAALMLVGVAWAQTSEAADAAPEPEAVKTDIGYRLGAGDRVRVTVFGHEDLSGEFEVDGSGNVSLPLIRNVRAAGLTLPDFEQQIIDRLRPDYLRDPSVSVEVLNYRPYFILGEVNSPGSYAFENGITLDKAVAKAGGYTYRARTGRVKIIRANDASRTPVDAGRDTLVLPGDVIEVPERYF
jgi:polysaccharide export outer membrane protein